MSILNKKIQDAYIKLKNEASYGVYGKRYIPKKDDGTDDYTQDFPNLEDPTDYVTHVPLEQETIEEAEKNPEEEEEVPEEGEEEAPDEEGGEEEEAPPEEGGEEGMPPEGMEGGEEGMPPGGMEGGDPNMAGMPGQEPPLTSSQIGRVYELKKIYSRLSSVESFLSRTTDDKILEIRKMVANAIDLFELVISNFQQYKDNIDEIIVMYYKFLKVVYESIKDHFKRISRQ